MDTNTTTASRWWRKIVPFDSNLRPTTNRLDFQTSQARRSLFLRILNRAWLGMGIVVVLLIAFFPQHWSTSLPIGVFNASVYFVIRTLNRRGYVRLAAAIFSVMVNFGFLAIFMMLAQEQGMNEALLAEAPTLMMMGLAILFAGALIDTRAAFGLTVLNSAILVGIVVVTGSDDPRISVHIFWWLLAITVWLYERTLAVTLAQLREARENLENAVTERTAQLSQALEQIEVILNNSNDVIVLADAKGNILKTNPAFDDLLGARIDQAIENLLRVIPSDSEMADYAQAILDVIYSAIPQRIEAKILLEDDSLLDADLALAPVKGPGDDGAGVILSLRDITHLKEVDRVKTRFVANAAHDLSNPLAALKTRLYLLKNAPHQLDKHLDVLEQQTQRMEHLIDDLRTLSALDRGVMKFQTEQFDFNALVARVVEANRTIAAEKNQALTFEPAPDLPQMNADLNYCERVVVNLTANAISYTPPGGQVRLASQIRADQCVLTVRDSGIGIAPEDLPHIFERFYRGDNARDADSEGTGLGLSIVKEIVEPYGGSIEVESECDQGSTFTVSLPLKQLALR